MTNPLINGLVLVDLYTDSLGSGQAFPGIGKRICSTNQRLVHCVITGCIRTVRGPNDVIRHKHYIFLCFDRIRSPEPAIERLKPSSHRYGTKLTRESLVEKFPDMA